VNRPGRGARLGFFVAANGFTILHTAYARRQDNDTLDIWLYDVEHPDAEPRLLPHVD
jgi:hypothetical protein